MMQRDRHKKNGSVKNRTKTRPVKVQVKLFVIAYIFDMADSLTITNC